MKTIVHVNQHHIRANSKGAELPVLTVKTYNSNRYANAVEIDGPCRVIYSPDKPLNCGANVWIETEGSVTLQQSTPDGTTDSPKTTTESLVVGSPTDLALAIN